MKTSLPVGDSPQLVAGSFNILIDSSVWIDYFRGGKNSEALDALIDDNLICTNPLILAELIPALKVRSETRLIALLEEVLRISLHIDWENVIHYQTTCLSHGINKVGIADLIILDNVIQNDLVLFSLDRHFQLMKNHIDFNLFIP